MYMIHTEPGSLWLGEDQLSRAPGDESRMYKDASDPCSIPIGADQHLTNPKGHCHRQGIHNMIVRFFLAYFL